MARGDERARSHAPIAVLGTLQTNACAHAAGEPFEAAASALRPPLFWNQRDRMQRQARRWSTSRIGRALERLIEAESQAMRAYAIKDEIAQRALMDIATLARAGTGRRS